MIIGLLIRLMVNILLYDRLFSVLGTTVIMFQPKGLPIDIVAARSEQWDGDGHSHSWLTLAELKGYKESVIKYFGLLTVAQAEALDSNSEHPTIWCQASSDKSLVYREWQDIE